MYSRLGHNSLERVLLGHLSFNQVGGEASSTPFVIMCDS